MNRRIAITAWFALTCLPTYGTSAQITKKAVPADAAAGVPSQQTRAIRTAEEMNGKQIELIDKVSAYFNQMHSLKGEFVQTSAGGSRLRGKFYLKRPGRFRLDYARPGRLVIVSDGRYLAIQDHDLKTDDRWELDQTPLGVLLRQDVNLLRDARFFDVGDALLHFKPSRPDTRRRRNSSPNWPPRQSQASSSCITPRLCSGRA